MQQGHWKETTVNLTTKNEFNYVVQSEDVNCIIICNSHISTVYAGTKPGMHDIIIPPKQVGIITRPFAIEYVYLLSDKNTSINLIETNTKNPIDNLVQQETAKHISIVSTVGLTANELNRDKNLNIGVNIANAHDIFGTRWTEGESTNAGLEVVLDTGEFGRPHVNIYIQTNVDAVFSITGGNEWNRHFFNITSHSFPVGGGVIWKHLTISFRFIRVVTTAIGNHYIQITATR